MIVGDLVRHRQQSYHRRGFQQFEGVGIIIEVHRRQSRELDYRTPASVLVFYGLPQNDHGTMKNEIWFHKNELELVQHRLVNF